MGNTVSNDKIVVKVKLENNIERNWGSICVILSQKMPQGTEENCRQVVQSRIQGLAVMHMQPNL